MLSSCPTTTATRRDWTTSFPRTFSGARPRDHPQTLEERGGWLNRDSADWYAEYAAVLFDRLGDRVTHWLPMNEIISSAHAAYFGASYPPWQADTDVTTALRAIHHQLLGQGRAVQAFRASGSHGAIGNWHLQIPISPASDSERDATAAARMDAFANWLPLDAQLLGDYPRLLVDWRGESWPHDAVADGDLKTISTPIDFVGLNYYFTAAIAHGPSDALGLAASFGTSEGKGADGLRDALAAVRDRYRNPPVCLTEIGTALKDSVRNGKVNDPKRIAYLRDHLIAAHAAIGDGVDLRGVIVFAALDSLPSGRYGLIYVDFKTQRRIIKASGNWYRDVIAANGFASPPERKGAPGE